MRTAILLSTALILLVPGCDSLGQSMANVPILSKLSGTPDDIGPPDDATGIGQGVSAEDQARVDAETDQAEAALAATPVAAITPNPPPPPAAGAQRTVASLGDPAKPGLWLETPLVTSERKGRIIAAESGVEATVTLIPLEGPTTGSSRLSLQAMQVLRAPLTELVELDVYPG
ncbi:hypothetical protein [Chachezhania antarctica]|uniref:hypothetical protein n=1 Tax=Chachezhania antarctica TaxID=2340860 RepID=UPI000EAD743D|nr:hypothetical protein [Chachezhania antarctica]